ncbi:sulfotransferase [Alteromonas stellipolaris]|uniref:sulfotransferase domain-containing protein n=1 Tax=Alteromonas stellipolaris TaxID=233316 RepID=UPI002117A443|nr:sulfotransferase domain-containing protein [Alteromonas stellipolaris]MCQ8847218.1 sulfotransferase [Alteromonas stellipolaris]
MFGIRSKLKRIIKERKNRNIVTKSVRNNEFTDVIWLIGDGRSGSTWIANLINADRTYREMFEPFHPVKVPAADKFKENMYLQPNDSNTELFDFMETVFEGTLTNLWVDQDLSDQAFSGLIIKDVFANLHARWAIENFSYVKPILLIRNPLSVASSKYVTRRWNWPEPSLDLFSDKKLIDNHLNGFQKTINDVLQRDDYIEKQVLNWCIIHKVLSEQFTLNGIHIICYETAYLSPKSAIEEVLNFSNKPKLIDLTDNILNASSKVSFKGSSIVEKKNPLTIWQDNLTKNQIELACSLLEKFGFSKWYPDLENPNLKAIKSSFISR